MSPLGAVCIVRGWSRPLANTVASKPGGKRGLAPEGRGTTDGLSEADALANGAGSASGLIWRVTPGASARQSPNAAAPERTGSAWTAAMGIVSTEMANKNFMGLNVHPDSALPSTYRRGPAAGR